MTTKLEQRRESIDKLLDAAMHLFVSMGYSSTNLDQIAMQCTADACVLHELAAFSQKDRAGGIEAGVIRPIHRKVVSRGGELEFR